MSDAKRALRQRLRLLRGAMDLDQRVAESVAASRICMRFAGTEPASYAALPDELDLSGLHRRWWDEGRAVLLPRVLAAGRLAWHRVMDLIVLRPGFRGIPEPDPALAVELPLPHAATIFVPGLAFTRDGRRLGQGGGYYDRLLAERPDLRAIGVGFACQLVEDLPSEPHDRPLSGLVIAGELVLAPH